MIGSSRVLDASPAQKTGGWSRSDAWALAGLFCVAVVSTAPFFYAAHGGMPEAHDLQMHWVRMIAFDEGLRSGELYPRWLASLNYGYGAATTLFYAPAIYYALSAAHAITGGWQTAIEVEVIFAAAASAAACYYYLRCWIPPRPAAVASALYLLLPYRLIDLYHRAALAELLTFVWMPLVMLSLTHSLRKRTVGPVIVGSGVFALMVLSHPPTAYLFGLSIAVFGIVLGFAVPNWRTPVRAAAMLAIGGGLSAFYAIPAVAEVKDVRQDITSSFLDRPGYLTNLIFSEPFDRMIAVICIVTFVLSALYYFSITRSGAARLLNSGARAHLTAWFAVSLLCVLMMLPIAAPLVLSLPGFSGTGFLWRWLAMQLMATTVVGGFAFAELAGAYSLASSRVRRMLTVLATSSALVLGLGLYASARASNLKVRFKPPMAAVEEAFTPKSAADVRTLQVDAPPATASAMDSTVTVLEWKPGERLLRVTSPKACDVEIRTFAFPGWEASVDSVAVPIRIAERNGAIVVGLPSGEHELRIIFTSTPVRRAARWVSLITLSICVLAWVGSTLRSVMNRQNSNK